MRCFAILAAEVSMRTGLSSYLNNRNLVSLTAQSFALRKAIFGRKSNKEFKCFFQSQARALLTKS